MEFTRRLSDRLALAGGILMLALAVLVTVSVLKRWLTPQGVPGDFELMQIGLALAVFAFMPWCQLRGGNLFVDTFTGRLPPGLQRRLDGLWTLVYAAVAAAIAVMMAAGAVETLATEPAAWCWAPARLADHGRGRSCGLARPGSSGDRASGISGARSLSEAALGGLSFLGPATGAHGVADADRTCDVRRRAPAATSCSTTSARFLPGSSRRLTTCSRITRSRSSRSSS